VAEADPKASALLFTVGDIVAPRPGADVPWPPPNEDAVVVSLEPFVLVSRECDVSWTNMGKLQNLRRVGSDRVLLWPGQPANRATFDLLQRCCAYARVSPTGGAPVPFDVALVRAHCERLIAEAGRRAQDRVVFEDWTRLRGMGPDNREPGAFRLPSCCRFRKRVHVCAEFPLGTMDIESGCDCGRTELPPGGFYRPGCLRCRGRAPVGGWPGPVAWERCSGCDGRGLCRSSNHDCRACSGRGGRWDTESIDQWYPCEPCDGSGNGLVRCMGCKGRGRVRKPGITPGFAAGPGVARTAQRLLDTLEGRCPWAPGAEAQPGECQHCIGETATIESIRAAVRRMDRDRYATSRERRVPLVIATHPAAYVLLSSTPVWKDGYESWLVVLSNTNVVQFEVTERPGCCRGSGHNLGGVLPPIEWGGESEYRDGIRVGGHIQRHRPDDAITD
jgi:hypothetical protein